MFEKLAIDVLLCPWSYVSEVELGNRRYENRGDRGVREIGRGFVPFSLFIADKPN